MSAPSPHSVRLLYVEQGYCVWQLNCHHEPEDPKWQADPAYPGYCWLKDNWDSLGSELLDLGDQHNHLATLPAIPVRPEGDAEDLQLLADYPKVAPIEPGGPT